jgi:hypothetical protein
MPTKFQVQISVIISLTILILIFLALIWSNIYDVKSGGGIATLLLFLILTTTSIYFIYSNQLDCEIKHYNLKDKNLKDIN